MSSGYVHHVKCATRVFCLELDETGTARAWCPSCRYMVAVNEECEIKPEGGYDKPTYFYGRIVR